ncbi:MAG: oligosaccharide flippase family protein [Candidatus Saccharimonadales bacterium]
MNLFKKAASNDFFRHNFIFLVGSVLVGVGNYLFYPVLSRMLEPLPFGEVQALTALFLQLTILLVVMGQVTINVIANYTNDKKKQEVLFELEKLAFLLVLGVSLLLALLSPHLKSALQFQSVLPFLILLAALVVTVPGSFRGAFLRAHKKFGAASLALLIGAYAKVVLGVLLTYLGFQVGGAMWAIFIAQLLTWFYAEYAARKAGYQRPAKKIFSMPDIKLVLPELKYALLVLVGFGSITLLASLDVFVVRYYFDPQTAGEYAGISTVAKIIFFFTASVAQVMFASIKLSAPTSANRKLFLRSMLLTAGLGSVALVFFTLTPDFFVRLLMGPNYASFAHYLPLLALAMLFVALLNIAVTYYVALRMYSISIILVTGLMLVGSLMMLHHNDLRAIIINILLGCGAIGGTIIAWRILQLSRKGQHAAIS